MTSRVVAALAALVLSSSLTFAAPTFRVRYPAGVPRVEIEGEYASARYTVWRSGAADGPWTSITDGEVLCLGSCYAEDFDAAPGATYFYRFELVEPDGDRLSFGPYAATISPALARRIGAAVAPNPGRGATRITLTLAGARGAAPVDAEAALFDLSGRRVATLHRGPLAPGSTTLAWDGRGDRGGNLAAGTYFLRVSAADGRSAAFRVLRLR